MLIVLALVFGAAVGVVLHFTLPHRESRGAVLPAMIGAVVGGVVWLVFTWLGLADTGWIWLASLAAPIAVTWPTIVALGRMRETHDAQQRERLKIS